MPETGLKLEGLAVARGGRVVFAGLDLALAPGEALEVRGANGAGKSSLLLALAGLIAPEAGAVSWPGAQGDIESRTLLHYLGHHPAIKPGLTIAENLVFWTDMLGGDRAGVGPALASAGLEPIATLDAGVLSAGQQRRLALARLLAIPRPVWLLDEPTSALDAEGALWVGAMVSTHLAGGGVAVIATHLDIAYGTGVSPRHLVLGAGA